MFKENTYRKGLFIKIFAAKILMEVYLLYNNCKKNADGICIFIITFVKKIPNIYLLCNITYGLVIVILRVNPCVIKLIHNTALGIKVTCDDDENFELRHSDLVDMLQKQIDVYSREKRTLEVQHFII